MHTSAPARSSIAIPDLASLLFLGAVWGAAFLFLRVASPETGPVWTAWVRIALAGVVLGAFIGPRRVLALRHRAVTLAIVGATFSAIPFSLLAFATLSIPGSLASVLMTTTPLFTALIGALLVRRRPATRVIAGLGVGFGTVALLLGGTGGQVGPGAPAAFAAGLLAAFSYAVAGTYVRRRAHDIPSIDLAAGQLIAGAVVLLPIALLSGAPRMPAFDGIASLVLAAIVSTAVAWPVYFGVAARTNATTASTATFIVPLFGMLWGGLLLREPIGPDLVLGFAMVLASLLLVLEVPLGSLATRARAVPGRLAGAVASAVMP